MVESTSPTVHSKFSSAGAFATTTSSLALGGTAADNVGVTQVTWSNSAGGSGTATGTTSWSASGIVLQSGSNVLTVTARDAANNALGFVRPTILLGSKYGLLGVAWAQVLASVLVVLTNMFVLFRTLSMSPIEFIARKYRVSWRRQPWVPVY